MDKDRPFDFVKIDAIPPSFLTGVGQMDEPDRGRSLRAEPDDAWSSAVGAPKKAYGSAPVLEAFEAVLFDFSDLLEDGRAVDFGSAGGSACQGHREEEARGQNP